MALKPVHAVVVGAGAGGGVVAKELSEAGLTVVLLERGGWPGFEQHGHDELISQRTTILGNAFGPDDERHRRVVSAGPGKWRVVLPSEGGYNNNAACVGSGTVSYGAMAWRFMEKDFGMRSTYGAVAGSTLEDWPIRYDDLEPFYEKAEWEIGVAGDMSSNPFSPPRRKPYPMPPFPLNREGEMLQAAAKKLGFHPVPVPMLRNSVPYGGRAACIKCRYCVGFACEVDAKCGTQNTVIPAAIATGNCEVRAHSVAKEVGVDDRGFARGVTYFDADDREQFQPADLVVVAASATETARLLLNSKSRLFPTGAGNLRDWVGRNLQGHAYAGAWGLFEQETYDDVGAGATIAIMDFNHGNPGLTGGAMLANEFIRLPYLFSSRRPPGAPAWGKAHKDWQRQFFKRSVGVMGPVQEMPVFEARVEVDPVVKDHWGIPVARLSGQRHPHDIEICRFTSSKAELWLKEAGAVQTWTWVPGLGLSGGQHQAGTCRMGNDPKTSVTNKFGQVHDIPNLFVADGSLHVTNGGFNPVLTIMALGYWIGDYIRKNWKGPKSFRS
ncbi:MAG TPA: GMC family oxidoreductase [Candidatus Paceibacterota bacterium]|nr:GMC family oxidoreductase [Candidatus Paceibacterota bacterium]